MCMYKLFHVSGSRELKLSFHILRFHPEKQRQLKGPKVDTVSESQLGRNCVFELHISFCSFALYFVVRFELSRLKEEIHFFLIRST